MEITNEQSFILSVLSDYLCERVTSVPDGLDFGVVCRYAKTHQIQGIVFKQCKEYLKQNQALAPYYSFLNQSYYFTVAMYQKRMSVFGTVAKAFDENGIKYVTVKGQAIAPYYPSQYLRTMGDVDIAMPTEDRNKADKLLCEMGFETLVHDDAEWEYKKNGIAFELHDGLEYEKLAPHREYINGFMKHTVEKDGSLSLEPEFHLIYLLLHLRKHLMSSGVGFRQFTDIVILAQKEKDNIDFNALCETLEKYQLLDFAKMCFAFCERWFGALPPIGIEMPDDEFVSEATKIVFENGVFGFDNEDNGNVDVNQLSKYQINQNTADKKELVKNKFTDLIFPSYETMCIADHYAFLRGRKWLLPVAWIYRLFRGIVLRKMKTVGDTVHEAMASSEFEDEVNRRTEWLRKWKV